MARSEEAILRRALKRSRTEGEQRQADRNEMRRQELKQKAKKAESDTNNNTNNSKRARVSDPTRRNETGTPFSGDRRSQFPRRDRGSGNPRRSNTTSRSPSSKPKSRHDEETSKKLVWARQADTKTLSKNQELRQRYKETGGEGMSEEDLERAKLLIARDQRKQERKNKKLKNKTGSDSTEANAETPKKPSTEDETTAAETPKEKEEVTPQEEPAQEQPEETKTKKKKTSDAQAKRDQNKALRKRYLETNGKGMKEDQIERAKLLIARDENKKQKRAAQKEQSEKKQ